MRVAITGGTGIVGSYITEALLGAGHQVTMLGRWPGHDASNPGVGFRTWTLGRSPDLAGQDMLVHAAFSHAPGRYRGGEGDDPAGFLRDNLDGSLRLFASAADAGLRGVLFLSSRAVFDAYPPGTLLTEDLPPAPDSLYGEVKCRAEAALAAMAGPAFRTLSLRATGIYGPSRPGQPHKWSQLFDDVLHGRNIAPRIATEVHGADLGRAVVLLLQALAPQQDAGGPSASSIAPVGNTSRPQPAAAAKVATSTPMARQAFAATAEGSIGSTSPPSIQHASPSGAGTAPGCSSPPTVLRMGFSNAIHISDLILDRHDLIGRFLRAAKAAGLQTAGAATLPPPLASASLRILDCSSLAALGWRGGGETLLDRTLAQIVTDDAHSFR